MIVNLDGMQYLTGLNYLELTDNYIEDLSPLSTMTNLTSLALDFNNITDISSLAGLYQMETAFSHWNC